MTTSHTFSILVGELIRCPECQHKEKDGTMIQFSFNENEISTSWNCHNCEKLVSKIIIKKLVD